MKLKAIPLLLLLPALMAVLVGCDGGNQPSDSPTTLPTATYTPVMFPSTPTKVPPTTPTPIPTPVPTPTATPTPSPTTTPVPVPTTRPGPCGNAGLDYRGQLLVGRDFTGQDLTCADFTRADLSETNLSNAILRNADLTETILQNTNLLGADITGTIATDTMWNETLCPDGTYAWHIGIAEINQRTSCGLPVLPWTFDQPADGYPWVGMIIGGDHNEPWQITPAKASAVWDICPRLITPAELTPHVSACAKHYANSGLVYLSYHPLSWVEAGSTGYAGITAAYPTLVSDGLWRDFDGNTNLRGEGSNPFISGGGVAIPTFSNSSDAWLDFMIGVIKTQVDAGMTGIAFDEGWGTLGPGASNDFSDAAMEGFRDYLETRYTTEELAARGINDIVTFNWRNALRNTTVYTAKEEVNFSVDWWTQMLGRPLEVGETYTKETFDIAREWSAPAPLVQLGWGNLSDYAYYNRVRLRTIYTQIRDEVKTYAASKGQNWYLSANVYNSLGENNAAIAAPVLDLPMGELSDRDVNWPDRNFTVFFKTMSALGKRYYAMFWPGQVLAPANDMDTESLAMFLADICASGGVSQHPGPGYNDIVNPFYELIQDNPHFFTTTDNRVALYYSLGNYVGDVGRPGDELNTYYGTARLLEDSHISYDVLYQGDPAGEAGTIRWVDQVVTLEDLGRYAVVVVPNAPYMTNEEVTNLLTYLEGGGTIVVLGGAGSETFSAGEAELRTRSPWLGLVTEPGIMTYGTGRVLVLDDFGGATLGQRYDENLSSNDLDTFQATLGQVYTSDIDTDFSSLVHVHKFRNSDATLEAYHLVNFDYDATSDTVRNTGPTRFAFEPVGNYLKQSVTYYTPTVPGGRQLDVTVRPDGLLEVTLPNLHIYGIVAIADIV